MSESTSAPAAPAAAPAPAPAPAAAPDGPALSVSEAGRVLSQQRRQGQPPPVQPPAITKPSANDAIAASKSPATSPAQPISPGKSPAAAPAAPAVPDGGNVSALDRALGVPGGEAQAGEQAQDAGQGYEIEGRRYSVTELRDALGKAADYTQKTQALAEQQRALATVLPYLQPELEKVARQISQPPQQPDPALIDSNPSEYLRQQRAFEAAVQEYQRLNTLTTLQQQAQAQAMAQQVAKGNEALTKEFPFWADPVERGKAQQEIITWATTKGGFTKDQLSNLTDAPMLKAMMKAAAFDRWVAGSKTAAPRQATGAPVRGAPPPPAATERVTAAETAFGERANIRNAASLLAARRAK